MFDKAMVIKNKRFRGFKAAHVARFGIKTEIMDSCVMISAILVRFEGQNIARFAKESCPRLGGRQTESF